MRRLINVFDLEYIPQLVSEAVKDVLLNKIEKDIKELHKVMEINANRMYSLPKTWVYPRVMKIAADLYHARRIGLCICGDVWFFYWLGYNFLIIDGKVEPPYDSGLRQPEIQWPEVKNLTDTLENILKKLPKSKSGFAA